MAEEVDGLTSLLKKIMIIVEGNCLVCIDEFKSKRVRAARCKTTCSYTSSAMAVNMFILEKNPRLLQRVIEDDSLPLESAWEKLGPDMVYPKSTPKPEQGIVNAIGLLWDVHDFSDIPASEALPYKRTGINYALDHGLSAEWFVEPLHLQEGVNVLSFYYANSPNTVLTVHHSFVYKRGSRCVLIDSWNGKKTLPHSDPVRKEESGYSTFHYDASDKLVGEELSRPMQLREYTISEFTRFLEIMQGETSRTKIPVMIDIFQGLSKLSGDDYAWLKVCILKQSKLEEVIQEGFAAEGYLFGGKRKRKQSRRAKKRRRSRKKNKNQECRSNRVYSVFGNPNALKSSHEMNFS